jgi:4-carboxymuconolactone decarboxylase
MFPLRARQAGIQDDIVDRLREKKELTGLAPDEAAVVHYGREGFRTHQVSQATFDAVLAQFGVQGLIELTNLMGYYALLAFNSNAFGAGLPSEITEAPLPNIRVKREITDTPHALKGIKQLNNFVL